VGGSVLIGSEEKLGAMNKELACTRVQFAVVE
jgi:hypothetical protein